MRTLAAVTFAAILLTVGCAKTGVTTPTTPSTLLADVNVGVQALEAVVALLPNIPANVKAEVATGVSDFSAGLTCTTAAISAGYTGATLATKVTGCFTSINISQFSPTAQSYLSAVNAAVQVIEAYFTGAGPNAVVSPIEAAQVVKLNPRIAKAGTKARAVMVAR